MPLLKYDRDATLNALSAMSTIARQRFVTSIAEQLLGAWDRVDELTNLFGRDVLEQIVHQLWGSIETGAAVEADAFDVAAALVPDSEDPEWGHGFAYAQNAASCVAYAAEATLTESPESAMWAGYQLYELADHVALQQMPDLVLNVPGAEEAILASPIVQSSLNTLRERLDQAKSVESVPVAELRHLAQLSRQQFRKELP
jgi:hypothetical protein